MQNRRWTVMIIPHGSDSPRSLAVSERALRAAIGGGAALAALCCVAALTFVITLVSPNSFLASRESRQMYSELADLRTRLTVLQDTIAMIGRRDERIRLLAGLPPVDSEVHLAGIGGPGTPDLRGEPLYRRNPMLGRLAFGARSDIDALIRRANVLSASFAEITDTLSHNVAKLAATPSIMPTAGWLSSHFSRSRFHPILHLARPHEGIDVSAPMGSPVVAPASGVVSRVTRETGYGLVLEVEHGNGIETKYAHLSRVNVRPGQRVTRGQQIANVGNSGLSTGPHLHYEIHVNGRVVDPLTYVLPGAIPD
jgi:Peptidase family M23